MATKASRRQASATASQLTTELLETADDMRASGLVTKAEYEEIAMRHTPDIGAAEQTGARIRTC
ncbi:hypothetical protein UP10_22010 [Bradyrhizobium sp. LTSPM299]|nr:hypothetical protein UP10_22010 [Bradyrhizobium sp. LTSPM299]